ncbi:MAG: hypothetical protein KKD32_03750 [Proteobacteria bacterium]|nr:hypothetical protein [Pseudomonadota bacterium]MBU1586275.1 hypothetical protein [Pseudomonadota bacterium]MBU2453171.1 hypothetical protein [Pseudomonadota bacterium]MBU2630798.1 hypothetical protein [Pseudomonadota bacterium]
MKFIKILFILSLVCYSCAAKQQNLSYVDIEGDPEIIKNLAVEIVGLIHMEKNVQNVVINLIYDKDNVLGDEILKELKDKGFALSDTDGTKTTFLVTSFEANKIYLSVTLDKMMLSRIYLYEAQTGTISVASPLNKGDV